MSSPGCLTRDQVTAYLLGNLTEIEMDETARHLGDCTQCQAVADELESLEDGLIGALRGSKQAERFLDEPEFEEARLKAAAAWAPAAADQGSSLDGAQLPGQHDPPPERLGQYQLLDVIGRGGMGAVYRALHTVLDRIVALKILSPEQTRDARAVARFEREIKAIGKLDHPNVVRPVDAGADGEVHYLVMDFVDGHDLGSVVRKLGPLAVADACELVRQAAVGLQYVYQRSMVHRDIKPPNLILDKQGVVKLLDLGLSLLSEQPPEDGTLTSNGILMGTCDYIAPEQCEDSHNVDIRADLYSLGCTLYQLLCGHVPFPGPRYNTRMKKAMAHVHDPVPPIRDLRDGVPEPLADVLDRLLTKSPEDRYQTPAELVSALEPLAAGSDLEALLRRMERRPEAEADTARSAVDTPIHVSSALVDTHPSEQPAPVHTAHTATQPTRRRWKPITIAVALAAVLLLGVVITITKRNGTIVIETTDPNVRVSVTQDGEEVAVADAQNGWTIRLRSGEYDLSVKGSPDRFKMDRDSVTVTRGDEMRVRVTLKRLAHVSDKPAPIGTNQKKSESTNGEAPTDVVGVAPGNGKWISLFDGKSLSGWRQVGSKGRWTVKDGALIGVGGLNKLVYWRRQFESFALRAECRVSGDTNSGVFLRTTDDEDHEVGYEVQISGRGEYRTGSLWGLVPYSQSVVSDDEWFTLEVQARKNRITVKVNGVQTVDFTDTEDRWQRGYVALQGYDPDIAVRFRKIEVYPFSDEPALAIAELDSSDATPQEMNLFNGHDLAGWIPMWENATGDVTAETGWAVRDREIVCETSEPGWLRSERRYGDFVLSLEFRLAPGGNSGVIIRSSGEQRVSKTGIEIQLIDEHHDQWQNIKPVERTGAIHGVVAPNKSVLRPNGEWNSIEIEAIGPRIRVTLNGSRVVDADIEQYPQLKTRPRSGFIGLFNSNGQAKGTAFRNIRIRDQTARGQKTLTPEKYGWKNDPDNGFVSLFDGETLNGWEMWQVTGPRMEDPRRVSGGWQAEDGTLVCTTDEAGWLKSPRKYADFVLRLGFKVPIGGNSGIFIRCPAEGHLSMLGMEIQIIDEQGHFSAPVRSKMRTGAIAHVVGPTTLSSATTKPAGEWNSMEIRCEGDRVQVSLNGVRVVDTSMMQYEELRDRPRSGFIGLSNWHGEARGVVFRDIRIKELSERTELDSSDATPEPPLSDVALVARPSRIRGVKSWTIETIGHRGAVNAVEYSPDGRFLATACDDGVLRLWEVESAELKRALIGHDGTVKSVSWSPDSQYLATGGGDNTIRLWDAESGLLLRTLRGHAACVNSVDWSPDGQTIASGSDDKAIRFWNVSSGEASRTLRGFSNAPVTAVEWSPVGTALASGHMDLTVRLWDSESGNLKHSLKPEDLPEFTTGVHSIVWTPDGKTVASGYVHRNMGDVPVCLWDVETGKLVRRLLNRFKSDCGLACSPDGEVLVAVGRYFHDKKVRHWDLRTGKLILQTGEVKAEVRYTDVDFAPNGRTYARSTEDGAVHICETQTGSVRRTLPFHTGRVLSTAFSADGKLLACGNQGCTVRVLEVASGQQTTTFAVNNYVCLVAWSPNATRLLAQVPPGNVGAGPWITIWDIDSRRQAVKWQTDWMSEGVVAWSPDGTTVATSNKKTTKLWEASSGILLRELRESANGLAWTRDGASLVAASTREFSFNTGVKLYEAHSGRVVRQFPSGDNRRGWVRLMAFSPQQDMLACTDPGPAPYDAWYGSREHSYSHPNEAPEPGTGVHIHDFSTGAEIAHLRGLHASHIDAIQWLGHGKTLLSGSASETRVFDVENRKVLRTIEDDGGAFSSDGQFVACRGASAVRLRRLSDGQLLHTTLMLSDQKHAVIALEGHYRGSSDVENSLVYVVQTDEGQETLSPDEFSKRFGWKNVPR